MNTELFKTIREFRDIDLRKGSNDWGGAIDTIKEEIRIAREEAKNIKIEEEKINIKQFLITAMKNDPELVDLDKLIDIVNKAYSEILEMRYNEFYEPERLITLDEGKID